MTQLHEVLIDVIGDRLAFGIANRDRARVVHASPHPRSVTIRARLCDAVVCATRLSVRGQHKRLFFVEVVEENGRSRAVEARVSGRIFRMRRRIYERFPAEIKDRVRIAIGVR